MKKQNNKTTTSKTTQNVTPVNWTVNASNAYKKHLEKFKTAQNWDQDTFDEIIYNLFNGIPLDYNKHHDRPMSKDSEWKDCRDCHISPNIVMIYRINRKTNTVDLIDIGSHSSLKLTEHFTDCLILEYL